MGNFYRVAYIPMPKITRKRSLEELITEARQPGATFSAVGGIGFDDAWKMYTLKQGEIEAAGVHLLKRLRSKLGKGAASVLRHGDSGAPLRNIRAAGQIPTVLYVHCHGNSEKVGFAPLYLTASQLAARLRDDGLDRNGQRLIVKLWSCHSGEPFGGHGPIYAQEFTNALRALGYYDVDVYGYVGALRVGDNANNSKTATLNDGRELAASTSRIIFHTGAARGEEISEDEDEMFT